MEVKAEKGWCVSEGRGTWSRERDGGLLAHVRDSFEYVVFVGQQIGRQGEDSTHPAMLTHHPLTHSSVRLEQGWLKEP